MPERIGADDRDTVNEEQTGRSPAPTSGLFANSTPSAPIGSSLFSAAEHPGDDAPEDQSGFGGATTARTGSLFDSSNPEGAAQPAGLFGTSQPDAEEPAGLFGAAEARSDSALPADTAPQALPTKQKRLYRGRTAGRWVLLSVNTLAAIVVVASLVVLIMSLLVEQPFMRAFLKTYPGIYALPSWAPVGIPWYVEWAHFFNAFLILLMIRTGLQIKYDKRPVPSWTPRWNRNRRISLTTWLHVSLDLLWFVNGIVFVIVLFATEQWVRIVPTSWAVFPNALSAIIQYASLNWPTEDGWVNYNSVQQLAYFLTVFIAAPLAALTGVRMSGIWPKGATRLNRLFPLDAARKIHFPVMLYFVAFIIVHVFLVFATGALRNLNHMYAGQDTAAWTGFFVFIGSLIVMVGGVIAARPGIVAPIASLFGRVSR